ncbi:AAA family ATPase [Winogradskyella sp.]|jgi:predicted ATP-dependent endonuclease of OLD family|uniref:ATP-dependent nuclease n=1 Tax=Winogradskyella sp. TaxID=1883156 RepID=UPI0025E73077|nr:AAA family ATPase [Winogradskyella sp.]MCT4629608.1 AAA family ATPase [Winogradskyella sp.]
MIIKKIKVENFRLLNDFSIDLEENLSLIIGKNNTGKTSLLSVMEKFINEKSQFSINDFTIDKQLELSKLENKNSIAIPEDLDFTIKLLLEIHYDNNDNLKNISPLILNLEEENVVVIGFEHSLNSNLYELLQEEFRKFKADNKNKNIIDFLKIDHNGRFFINQVKTIEYKADGTYGISQLIKDKKTLTRIINFQNIKAKREVNNSDTNRSDNTLSKLSADYYESIENTPKEEKTIKKLKKELENTDDELNKIYPEVFEEVLKKVEIFGGKEEGESIIGVISSLQSKNILKENTSVVYKHIDHHLPEDYHGLGYLNLFAMIFDIELKCREFRKEKEILENQIPADINLLFIEEPEAHTHPQMQHVFIKNITRILENEKNGLDSKGEKVDGKKTFILQSIITTHSSHITAESNFDDIKYFLKEEKENNIISKNLKDLKKAYSVETDQYAFLKQYLTINRAELFFADKAILIEGDTERILLPVMMRKLDLNEKLSPALLSQNISIVEVGAYSHIFEKFIDFIGIKSLLVTDFDTFKLVDNGKTDKQDNPILEREKCRVGDKEASGTSNNSLTHFLSSYKFDDLKNSVNNYIIKKGSLCVSYQHMEKGYHARSFEDAFIHLNREFITKNKTTFQGLKKESNFDLEGEEKKDAYSLAEDCIKKKTHFALDIVYHSNESYSNWGIPSYIKEGLLWLQK